MKLVVCAGLLSFVSQCLHTALLLRSGCIDKHGRGNATLLSLPTTVEGTGEFAQTLAFLMAQPEKDGGRLSPLLCNREQTLSIFLLRLQLARSHLSRLHPFYNYKGLAIAQTKWQ